MTVISVRIVRSAFIIVAREAFNYRMLNYERVVDEILIVPLTTVAICTRNGTASKRPKSHRLVHNQEIANRPVRNKMKRSEQTWLARQEGNELSLEKNDATPPCSLEFKLRNGDASAWRR